jgi:hypothetical protein
MDEGWSDGFGDVEPVGYIARVHRRMMVRMWRFAVAFVEAAVNQQHRGMMANVKKVKLTLGDFDNKAAQKGKRDFNDYSRMETHLMEIMQYGERAKTRVAKCMAGILLKVKDVVKVLEVARCEWKPEEDRTHVFIRSEKTRITLQKEIGRVVLKDREDTEVDLGDMYIRLDVHKDEGVWCRVEVTADSRERNTVGDGYYHPYVYYDGKLCLGEGYLAADDAMLRGDFMGLFDIVEGVLKNYEPEGSPITKLEVWTGNGECSRCEGSMNEDESYFCEGCTSDVCGECQNYCDACGTNMCNRCMRTSECVGCGEYICEECSTSCAECGETVHKRGNRSKYDKCSAECDECGDVYCNGCAENKEKLRMTEDSKSLLCSGCREECEKCGGIVRADTLESVGDVDGTDVRGCGGCVKKIEELLEIKESEMPNG